VKIVARTQNPLSSQEDKPTQLSGTQQSGD